MKSFWLGMIVGSTFTGIAWFVIYSKIKESAIYFRNLWMEYNDRWTNECADHNATKHKLANETRIHGNTRGNDTRSKRCCDADKNK